MAADDGEEARRPRPPAAGFLTRLHDAEARDAFRLRIRRSLARRTAVVVARGAFAEVLRDPHARVAIKRFRRRDADARELWRREREALASVAAAGGESSACVARLLDDQILRDGTLLLVLELGTRSLRAHLPRLARHRARVAQSASLVGQLVRAVRYLHALGLAHRDLKPDNLLVCGADEAAVLKVCDFGFACPAAAGRRHTLCGSLAYMAPELLVRNREGYEAAPVDVWSAGAVVYEVLHGGRLAFADAARSAHEVRRRIRHGQCGPVAATTHALYRALLRACFTLDPAARPTAARLRIPVYRGPAA